MRWRFAVVLAASVVPFVGGPVAQAEPAPEIRVTREILDEILDVPSDGPGNLLGITVVGMPLVAEFTIANEGAAGSVLELSNAALPAGLSLAQPLPGSIAAGHSLVIRARCDAASVGDFFGALSFDTNDPDENPYRIVISCSVVAGGWSGVPSVWGPVGTDLLRDGLTLHPGERARVWSGFMIPGSEPLVLGPVEFAPAGPTASGWYPQNVTSLIPVYFTLSCSDGAGASLLGSYTVTVRDQHNLTASFQLRCVEGDLPTGGSDFTSMGLRAAAVLLSIGGVLLFTAGRRRITSA